MILYVTKFKEGGHWCVLVLSLEHDKPCMNLCRVAEYAEAVRLVSVFKQHQRRKAA